MKPAPLDYIRAGTTQDVLSALTDTGNEARILAGGQSLMAMLNMRLAQPSVLIDIMHVEALAGITVERGWVVVPAAVRQAELAEWPLLAETLPLLAQIMPWIGHAQTRARGTVCGSIAHADPSAELPLALASLGGDVVLRCHRSKRIVPAADFLEGTMLTSKEDDEFIEAVRFPVTPAGTGTAFREIGRRRGDFAIVACVAIAKGTSLRLAIGGVNDTPLLRDFDGLDLQDIPDALNEIAWSMDARGDLHADARYRRELVRNLGAQVIAEARKCAA